MRKIEGETRRKAYIGAIIKRYELGGENGEGRYNASDGGREKK